MRRRNVMASATCAFFFLLHCSPCYPPHVRPLEVKPLVLLVGFEWEDVFIPLEV